MLYICLSKAPQGMLRATLLFYKRLVSDLEDTGFEVNPYDPCVANNMATVKYMTVCWHVDDLNFSRMEDLAVPALSLKSVKLCGPNSIISVEGCTHT